MIVVDTSAFLAVLLREEDAELYARAIADADACILSAVSLLEACLVVTARGAGVVIADIDDLLQRAGIAVIPFDRDHAVTARDAFERFGKGRHPAGLNMGDCAAYALARSRRLQLLFKGKDFSKTDIASALP